MKRTPLKRVPLKARGSPLKKVSKKAENLKEQNKEEILELHKVMFDWCNSFRKKKCEACGLGLGDTCSLSNIHHLLPKSKYPEVKLDTRFYCLLCLECHSSWELSPKNEYIKERTKQALKIYNEERAKN